MIRLYINPNTVVIANQFQPKMLSFYLPNIEILTSQKYLVL